jgi:hypothetical protein
MTPVPPIALTCLRISALRPAGRDAQGGLIGEEATAALGPGGFAGGIVLRLRRERLTPPQFHSELIRGGGGSHVQSLVAWGTRPKMQRGGHDYGGDESEAGGAADCWNIEETPAHQWNICAEPG